MNGHPQQRPATARTRRGSSRAGRRAVVLALAGMALAAGDAAHAQHLAWTDTWFGAPRLYRARLDGSYATSRALTPGSLPEGLAFDATGGALFLGEAAWSGAMIRRTDAALSSPSPFFAGPSTVRGLAMDEANGVLLWSTTNLVDGCTLRRVNRDGSDPAVIIGLGDSYVPHGVASDPGRTRAWFTDSRNHYVGRIRYDGTDGWIIFVCEPGSFPYGIAYDTVNDQVYWSEYASGRIMRGNENGTGATPVLTGLANPTHLALDAAAGRLYWVEGGYGLGRVKSANLDGSDVVQIAPLQSYGGVALLPGQVTDVPVEEPGIRYATGLLLPWPNPAPGVANVAFTLAAEGDVELVVHDVAGRRVAVLASGRYGPGPHTARWTAADRAAAPPGVYFVRLRADGGEWTQRLVMSR